MSNAYFYHDPNGADFQAIAHAFSSLLSHQNHSTNHYAIAGQAVLGLSSLDRFRQGVFPRYLDSEKIWGIFIGELHSCDTLEACRRTYPGTQDSLMLLTKLAKDHRLAEVLPTLNGAFFVILWDPESQCLTAANDRYGLYPMYWGQRDARFCLASRTTGPVLAGVVHGKIDPLAVAQILTVDDFAGNRTMVRDVSTFPPGTILTRTPNKLDWRTYWTWDYPKQESIPVEEWGRRSGEALIEAVRRQAGTGRTIGITLSGGLDSRSVAAAAVKAGIMPVTFTWGEDQCYDRVLAAEIARTLGTEHEDHPYDYSALVERFEEGVATTEGMCNIFDMHFLAHIHIIAEVDVVLNGFAGDAVLGETFLRPQWSSPMPPEKLAERLFGRFNKILRQTALADAMPVVSGFDPDDYPLAIWKRQLKDLRHLNTPDAAHRYLFDNHVRRKTAMGTVLMREAAESAACFFDYDFNDLVRSIPAELRAKHRTYRAMIRTTFPEVAGIPWQATLLPPLAPEWQVLLSRVARHVSAKLENAVGWHGPTKRQPPALFAQRLRAELRDWMDALITAEYPLSEEILRPSFYRRAWQEHLEGKDNCRLLGALVPILHFSKLMQDVQTGQLPSRREPVRVRP